MKRYIGLLIVVFFVACTENEPIEEKGLKIVCTTGMIGDGVQNLVDSTCTVNTLMGPGTDPHLFKPTKQSLDLLSDADIIVANGLHLEGRMQDILEKMQRNKTVIFIGDAIPAEDLLIAEGSEFIPDPHIWFDVSLWNKSMRFLSDELRKFGVLNEAKAEAYRNELSALEESVQKTLSEIPEERRVLITAHDAFSYFGEAYGMEVIGLQGISTVSEYGIRDVTNMVNLIVSRNIPAVFVESSISSRSIEAVIEGCEQKGFQLELGGTLYSDALGTEGSGAETYISMVDHNVATITKALK